MSRTKPATEFLPNPWIMKRKTPPTKTFKTPAKRVKTQSLAFQRNTATAFPEKKAIDVTQTALTTSIAGVTWTLSSLLNGISQGSNSNNRIGRKTQNKSIKIIYTAQMAATTTLGCNIRVKVIYDKQSNGAAPQITDVFTTDSFFSNNNLDNTDRFITIIDEILPPLSVQGEFNQSGKFYRKLNLETLWSGTGGAIANITSGSFYLLVSQNGNGATAAPTFTYNSRIRYVD